MNRTAHIFCYMCTNCGNVIEEENGEIPIYNSCTYCKDCFEKVTARRRR